MEDCRRDYTPFTNCCSKENPMRFFQLTAIAASLLLAAWVFVRVGDDNTEPIAMIKQFAGSVKVDEKSPNKEVIEVHLRTTRVTDADLKHLKILTQLQVLDLGHTAIGDAGLEHLKD